MISFILTYQPLTRMANLGAKVRFLFCCTKKTTDKKRAKIGFFVLFLSFL